VLRVLVSVVVLGVRAADAAAQPTAPRARLIEDLRLDANTEDFSVVARVLVSHRGDIAVPLRQDLHIRLFDSTGKRIATVGRRGAGPGEFQNLLPAGWIGDTLWVFDPQLRRTTFVARDGRVVRASALPTPAADLATASGAPGKFLYFTPLAFYSNGAMLSQGRIELPARPAMADISERVLVSLSAQGIPLLVGRPPAYDDERWWMRVDGFGLGVPFAEPPVVAASPDGSRFAYLTTLPDSRDGGVFALSLFRPDGTPIVNQVFPFRGVRIRSTAIDSALEALVRSVPRSPDRPADLAQRFQSLARQRIPMFHAPVVALVLGEDGTTWLTLRATAEGVVALVLDAHGRPVGSVVLPPRSRIAHASANRLHVIQADDVGLTSVVRYRVAGLACAASGCRE
jgi:hypothetical protein